MRENGSTPSERRFRTRGPTQFVASGASAASSRPDQLLALARSAARRRPAAALALAVAAGYLAGRLLVRR